MKEYCDFIFSVGEKTEIMAKLVSDYTQVILKGIDETESEWSKVFNPQSPNPSKSFEWSKMEKKGDLNDDLDILLRR